MNKPAEKANPMLAVLSALIANLVIGIMKTIVGFLSGSQSIINEAVHSYVDVTDQVLLFVGDKRAKKQVSKEHSFGHAREKYFWAFVVSVLLFTVGGIYGIVESVEKFQHLGEHIEPAEMFWPIVLLSGAMIVEIISLSIDFKLAKSYRKPGESIIKFVHRTTIAELIVCICEDFAAVAGCFIGLIGVGLTAITGNGLFDAAGGLGIGILLCVIAAVLAIEFHSLIIGESIDHVQRQAIENSVAQHEVFSHILQLRTTFIGPETLLIALKLGIDGAKEGSVDELAGQVNSLEAQIRANSEFVGLEVLIFVEIDKYEEDYQRLEVTPNDS